jgi:quercetin dioxygenase-like cupin family protein
MSLYNWDEVTEEKLREDLSRKIISGEKVMVAQIFLKKGSEVAAHSHESEQIIYLIDGSMEVTMPSGKVKISKGEVLVIPSNVEHSAIALEDTIDMDIFSPIREDWLTGEDSYLREQ